MEHLKRLAVGVLAPIVALSLMLVMATPVAAATLNVCGEVEAFAAPTAATDGGLTVDGETFVIPAGTDLDAATTTMLTALAVVDVDTCLTIETDDGTGEVTSIELAAAVEVCGEVTLEADGDAVVNGVLIPAEALSAAASGTLEAAAAADAEVCVTLMTDVDGSGGVLGAVVEADVMATVCATVDAINADSLVLSGISIPLADGADVDAEVTAGAELGLELTAGVDGLSAVAVVDLAGCGTGGASPGTGTPGDDDDTGGAGDGTGNGPGTGMLPDTSMSAAHGINPMLLAGVMLLVAAIAATAIKVVRRT